MNGGAWVTSTANKGMMFYGSPATIPLVLTQRSVLYGDWQIFKCGSRLRPAPGVAWHNAIRHAISHNR